MPQIVACPHCHNDIAATDEQIGKVIYCTSCRQPTMIPVPVALPKPAEIIYRQPEPKEPRRRLNQQIELAISQRKRKKTSLLMPSILLALLSSGVLFGFIYAISHSKSKVAEATTATNVSPVEPLVQRNSKPTTPPASKTYDSILQKAKQATVIVKVNISDRAAKSGSGFFIPGSGLIITNNHVIEDGREIQVIESNGTLKSRTYYPRIVGRDSELDLALLQTEEKDTPPALPLGNSSDLKETDEVFVIGYPHGEMLGREITVTKTSITSVRYGWGDDLIQLNGGQHPGNSGGPVLDMNGNVVGVSVSGIRSETICFAIPAHTVRRFLKKIGR